MSKYDQTLTITFDPGYDSESMFEQAKEAEMSVSDPEEYLVSRSDEDVMFAPHSRFIFLQLHSTLF